MKILVTLMSHFLPLYSVCGDLTIHNYPDLVADYEERLTEFNLRNRPDPFCSKSVEELERICEHIKTSKIFFMVGKNEAPSESVWYPKSDIITANELNDSDLKEYRRYSVKIIPKSDQALDVNLFPCPEKIIDEYWYFSYGFVDSFMYLFRRKHQEMEIEFVGVAELTPSLSASLMVHNREFERYFINVMTTQRRSQKPPTLKEEPLCWLNANQQFRLCSQVASAIHREKIMEINNSAYHVHNCKKVSLFLREIYENGDLYPSANIMVNSIVCGNQSNPTFFVVSDPRGEDSVFVLRNSVEIIKVKKKEKQFADVIAHVSHLSVLKYAKEFY